MGLKSAIFFYEELATLVDSGVNIIDALQTMAGYLKGREKSVAEALKNDLSRGIPLESALARFPVLFPVWQVNIIKYSEAGGTLKTGLRKIVDYLRADYAIRHKLIVGLAYPILLFNLAIFLLPVPALVQKGAGVYLFEVGKIFIPVYLALFAVYGVKKSIAVVLPYQYDAVVLYFPFVGRFVKSLHLVKFVSVLQCLCAAGVNVVSGWEIALESCDNRALAAILSTGLPLIRHGATLQEAFTATRIFPAKTLSLIAVGEKSGSIDIVLGRIVAYATQENETVISLLLTVIPVLIYLAVAGYIGFRIIAFYSEYFSKIIPN